MSPLLTEGDIRAPEVWVRVDIHDRRASPIGVPDSCPDPGRPPGGPSDALKPLPEATRHMGVATLKATPQS